MKHFLIITAILCVVSGGCKKSTQTQGIAITGHLIYQNPASDGLGYYFLDDTNATILFSTDFNSGKYDSYLNVHTTLRYINLGKTICGGGFSGCAVRYPLVTVVSITKI